MKILEIILERMVDPVQLAQRVANRYGKRTRYGHWEAPIKKQHIPLKSFNSRLADQVYQRAYDFRQKLARQVDPNLSHKEHDIEVMKLMDQLSTRRSFPIKNLIATQPFVRINDLNMLHQKISNKTPDIRVATYKGHDFIMDGHHAVLAAALRGDPELIAKHIDLG